MNCVSRDKLNVISTSKNISLGYNKKALEIVYVVILPSSLPYRTPSTSCIIVVVLSIPSI